MFHIWYSISPLETQVTYAEIGDAIHQQVATADNTGNAVQNYATISDLGEYSYAYQHPQQQSEEMDKGNKGYQQLGMGDYMHMYSKPSPLLVSNASRANAPSVEEREDEQ